MSKEHPKFMIVIFAAKIAKNQSLLIHKVEKIIQIGNRQLAIAWGHRIARNDFRVETGWKVSVTAVEMPHTPSQGQPIIPLNDEYALVEAYLDKHLAAIKASRLWATLSGYPEHKRQDLELNIILSYMQQSTDRLVAQEPVLHKEKEAFWGRIRKHIQSYFGIQEAQVIGA